MQQLKIQIFAMALLIYQMKAIGKNMLKDAGQRLQQKKQKNQNVGMEDCMPLELDDDGRLGYCWMHDFKCHSARTCYTWAKGGPIKDDKRSKGNQMKKESKKA